MHNEKLESAHRQVNAIAAKALDSLEQSEYCQSMHPIQQDHLRKAIFKMVWESFKVGLRAGRQFDAVDQP